MHGFQELHRLLDTGGQQKATAWRQLADEQLEHRRFGHAVRGISLKHRELVEVGQQQAFVGHRANLTEIPKGVVDRSQRPVLHAVRHRPGETRLGACQGRFSTRCPGPVCATWSRRRR